MIRADADRNFTFREAFDVDRREVRQARRRDDARPRRRAGRPLGRRPRHARLHLRLQAAGRRHLSRQHDHRRAHADAEEPAHRQRHASASRPTATTSCTGRTTSSRPTTSTPARRRTLGGASPASFVDTEFDHPGPKPSYGIAGYTSDGKSVIVQQRYDLWALPLDGSAARNLTNGAGAKSEMRFRYVRTEPAEAAGGGAGRRRAWWRRRARRRRRGASDDRSVEADHALGLRRIHEEGRLLRARERRVEGAGLRGRLVQQSDEGGQGRRRSSSRDRRSSSSPTCASRVRTSRTRRRSRDANPQQAEYMWGHRILFDFKNKDGLRLQGILALPDDYKPGEKRPMLVNFYEKNSQNLHRYIGAVVSHRHGIVADPGRERGLHHDAARRPLPHRRVAQRHARVRRGGDAEGHRDGLRRSEAHRHQRPQLRRRRRGVHRHALAAVRGGRRGRRRHRSLLRLQPELGLVVPGHRRQRRERQRLLPLRPGPRGRLAVGQPGDVQLRVRAHARAAK